YQHLPLDYGKHEIRLVKVYRDDRDDIHCDIACYDLDHAPPFTTLSYMWGSPPPTHTILVDYRCFEIRKRLYLFLSDFCGQDEYLWVDQLCIDQENATERSHQVRLMSEIYKRCTSVIMWLGGRSKTYIDAALEFKATSDVKSLATLLKHPYFTRLWVIQEILLPPEVRIFVGDNTWILWRQFSGAVLSNVKPLEVRGVPYTAVALVENRKNHTVQKGIRLEPCIQLFSGSDCSDPRDKVYGLMGLVHAAERVEVDYTKSTHEVYLDVVR
ncbi:HET-domain-containing protein, partial [Setomelanomma holmii]